MYRDDICGKVSLLCSHGNINYVARKLMSSSLLKRTQVYFIVWNGEDASTKDMRDVCREMGATNEILDTRTGGEFAIVKNVTFQISSVNMITTFVCYVLRWQLSVVSPQWIIITISQIHGISCQNLI
jgi:hypothetical protein